MSADVNKNRAYLFRNACRQLNTAEALICAANSDAAMCAISDWYLEPAPLLLRKIVMMDCKSLEGGRAAEPLDGEGAGAALATDEEEEEGGISERSRSTSASRTDWSSRSKTPLNVRRGSDSLITPRNSFHIFGLN